MTHSNHRHWFYFNLVMLGLVAVVVIAWQLARADTKSATNQLAENYFQQQAGYLSGLNEPLTSLQPLLADSLQPTDAAKLQQIKNDLLALRVPSGYQDFHLSLVLKLAQLEQLLITADVERQAIQPLGHELEAEWPAITRVQGELLALQDQYAKWSR